MRILWLVHILMPEAAEMLVCNSPVWGGWLVGLHADIQKNTDIELLICCPTESDDSVSRKIKIGKTTYVLFKGHYKASLNHNNYEIFRKTINEFQPDVIHIWGTEYTQSYTMIQVAKELNIVEKVIVSIQGLVSIAAKHYYAGLPEKIINFRTIRDMLRRDNIANMKVDFEERGGYEIEVLKATKNVIGRTDWDYACTKQINPDIRYFKCNETLRAIFYTGKWEYTSCEKHSIFFTQCSIPLKGFHVLLAAMPFIKKFYPNTKIYIASYLKSASQSIRTRLSARTYDKYIWDLIRQYKLETDVVFMGSLDEAQMKERFLKANVFVSSSSIENSPNSVGEAMLLGVPVVSSLVGGVASVIEDKKEGFLFDFNAPYMLAYYVCKVFSDHILATELSDREAEKARCTHNRDNNLNQILKIYRELS